MRLYAGSDRPLEKVEPSVEPHCVVTNLPTHRVPSAGEADKAALQSSNPTGLLPGARAPLLGGSEPLLPAAPGPTTSRTLRGAGGCGGGAVGAERTIEHVAWDSGEFCPGQISLRGAAARDQQNLASAPPPESSANLVAASPGSVAEWMQSGLEEAGRSAATPAQARKQDAGTDSPHVDASLPTVAQLLRELRAIRSVTT